MSFQAFMNDPKGYCRIHEIQLYGGENLAPAVTPATAPVANTAHGRSIQFTHVSNVTMRLSSPLGTKTTADWGRIALSKVGLTNKKRQVTYSPAAGGAFPNLRFLPWSARDVTFMQLDGGATFAVTGPLSGCTVSVVRHSGALWFFHANVATSGGVGVVNRMIKRLMIQDAGRGVGVPPTAEYFYCESGLTYTGLGFVWGRQRGGGAWKFYVHDIEPAATATLGNVTEDRKWAEL